jgi:peptidoglycan/LPS O-acetylase OafA/YrhL
LLYYANWYFIGDMDYFGLDQYSNILLHMWSLAVEEQFYFFWPLFLKYFLDHKKMALNKIIMMAGSIFIFSAALLYYFSQ